MDQTSFRALIQKKNGGDTRIRELAKQIGISVEELELCSDYGKFPLGTTLKRILSFLEMQENELRLKVGALSYDTLDSFLEKPHTTVNKIHVRPCKPALQTSFGKLYEMDCFNLFPNIESESIDLVFADPPFNLSKIYPSKINDSLSKELYLRWCEKWIIECCRILKYGGSFFLWNIPQWNFHLSSIIDSYLSFRNWIAVDIKYSLPISGRLYPSHYSLLYFIKNSSPKCFNPDRLEMKTCRKCFNEIKDYGGYKNKMNPRGINLSDVWDDISPVRHTKYKKRKDANELPIKLLDRVIEMATKLGDTVFDPFGGSGTTYVVAELKQRKWLGCEIGPTSGIKERFATISEDAENLNAIRSNMNCLFSEKVSTSRKQKGLWLPEDFL